MPMGRALAPKFTQTVIPDPSKAGAQISGRAHHARHNECSGELRSQGWFITSAVSSLEHCIMQTLCTFHYLLSRFCGKVFPTPARGGNGLGWKSFLWGVGGRRGCATQEINTQIFVKLLLEGTRQITSRVRDGKNPEFSKNTANSWISSCRAALSSCNSVLVKKDASCLDPPTSSRL